MDPRPAPPCVLVLFGASGDLARRKLVPSLLHLKAEGLLGERFAVVGVARSPLSREQFRRRVREQAEPGASDAAAWDWLEERLYYAAGDVTDAGSLAGLSRALEEASAAHGTGGGVLFYMATSPELFAPIAEACAARGLAGEKDGWRRFVVEKPFGFDLASARALNARLLKVLKESQIYRIDHYLGKETVQNLLVLRFGNGIFEPVWNRRYIDHVQVTVAETLGVEGRGATYERSGALRDMVPNHIFQLLSLTAMEPPASFDADSLRDEQLKALRALEPMTAESALACAVRGQYEGYRAERGVAPDSRVETFVAMRLRIDNWRWNGVPFYFRTGKRLPCRASEIVVQFKRVPHHLFRAAAPGRLPPNQLVVRIQPDEGIALSFQAKVPGQALRLSTVEMDFRYEDFFGVSPDTGYERLLYDAMQGDATLFKRADMVEASWSFVTPLLEAWAASPQAPALYPAGSWGPGQAGALLGEPWRGWRECAR